MASIRFPRLLIAGAAFLAACTSKEGATSSASSAGGTMVFALVADPHDVFPPYVGDLAGRLVQDQVFDRLAEIGPELETIGDKDFSPRLATKWTWAPDSLSIGFSLDPRARWHDGKPVTARDVKYSFWAFTDSVVGSTTRPLLANIDSVSIRDSLTPVFWFKKHTPEQFYDVAYQLIIMPEHVYGSIPAKELRTSPLTRTPIGSGRFRFVKWDAGSRLELIADTSNYRGRAKLDRVIIAPADPQTGATQLLKGETDFVEAFPNDRVAELDSSAIARPLIQPVSGYVFMAMNRFDPKSTNRLHPIFSDKRVRRALSMAVDRVAMLHNVFGNTGALSHGPFPSSASYADTTLQLPPFDTTAANALLDSAGWKVDDDGIRTKAGRPLKFNMVVPTTSLPRRRYAVLLQEQFRKIGAQVDLELLDNNACFARVQSGDFDTVLWAFAPDPSAAGTKQVWSTSGIGPSGQNLLRYSNPKVDALLDSSASTFDPQKMKAYTRKAFSQIIADAPAIFLYDLTLVYGINRRVNVAPTRTDEWWANLADWSIPADKRIDRDRIGLRAANP